MIHQDNVELQLILPQQKTYDNFFSKVHIMAAQKMPELAILHTQHLENFKMCNGHGSSFQAFTQTASRCQLLHTIN